MRYLVMLSRRPGVGPPPEGLVTALDAALGEGYASGMVIDAGGLADEDRTTYRLRAGALSRADGPDTGEDEVAGGYAVLDVRSHEEAAEGARRMMQVHLDHWPGWEGSADVRRVSGPA